jgi:hypothetical protein
MAWGLIYILDMKLTEKGKIIPPIQLQEPMESVSRAVQSWEHIISATHWNLFSRNEPDGADFYVFEQELGHIHLDGDLHLATNLILQKALVERGLARTFPYAQGWVNFMIRNPKDADHALWLFGLNYKRLMGESIDHILTDINSHS